MVFEFPVIAWSLSGGRLTDQFGRFEPSSTFLEGHRPNCDLECCPNPIAPTHYATRDLRIYLPIVFEFPEITWGSAGGHLEDQFSHFETFFVFLKRH